MRSIAISFDGEAGIRRRVGTRREDVEGVCGVVYLLVVWQ
jgi:hypothetical protein